MDKKYAEALKLISAGHSVKKASDLVGIKYNTLRVYLKRNNLSKTNIKIIGLPKPKPPKILKPKPKQKQKAKTVAETKQKPKTKPPKKISEAEIKERIEQIEKHASEGLGDFEIAVMADMTEEALDEHFGAMIEKKRILRKLELMETLRNDSLAGKVTATKILLDMNAEALEPKEQIATDDNPWGDVFVVG